MPLLSAIEREALSSSVRAACARLLPDERLRFVAYDTAADERGFDRELWRALCHQVGVAAVGVPEQHGGDGCGAGAQAAIAHELGRALAPVPFLSSAVLSSAVLAAAGDPTGLLGVLREGGDTAAAVVPTRDGRLDCSAVSVSVSGTGRLFGSVRHVLGATGAEHLLVVADELAIPALLVVEREQSGVEVVSEDVLDGTRPMATVTFDNAPAQRLTTERPTVEIIDEGIRHGVAVLTAEQVGATERVLQMAVEYAGTRRQFDRPIGSFQAVKHRCADMLLDLELARSASLAAVSAVDENSAEAPWLVSMAKAVCSETLRDASHANLQIHGGIGFTWEHAAGLYVKRARTDEVLFGPPTGHWNVVADNAALVAALPRDGRTLP
jgi:alkylation response protein AidB-like acyl-CoA dehydrogenase